MMNRPATGLIAFLAMLHGFSGRGHGADRSVPVFESLRYDEDYSSYANADGSNPWTAIKHLSLASHPDWFVSIGGEIREQFEYFNNADFGDGIQDQNGYLLQRYMLHADVRAGEYVRAFAQFKAALESGKNGGPSPVDEDELDVHQAFVEVNFPVAAGSLMTRIGRQEVAFGSQRIVSVREGPNVRRTFEGARLALLTGSAADQWRVDALALRPVETDRFIFDDQAEQERALWGVYATGGFIGGATLDAYYLGFEHEGARFDQGVGDELRHSVGTRLAGISETRAGFIDYNFEALYQWGRFGDDRIRAWTVASDTGFTFTGLPLTPRLGLRADIASGDRDPNDGVLGTFNPLFPKGDYFGESALLGPSNFIDLQPTLTAQLPRNVSLTARWTFFWRESTSDGIYGPAVNLLRSGGGSDARYVGSEVSVAAAWQCNPWLTLSTAYSHFFAGAFLRQSPPGEDADYFQATVQLKF